MKSLNITLTREQLKSVEINCIRQRITERGISQKWIAEKLDKTTNTVNGWCSNRVQPHLIDLYLLSLLLDCSIYELIVDIDHQHLTKEQKKNILSAKI